jgi:beta-lactamase regulating signal transducer with metallopeptidase domain
MGLFFIHIIKSSLCLVFFYLAYKVLLSRETFYKVNRFVLLLIIIGSVLLPFVELTVSQPAVATLPTRLKNIETIILQKQPHVSQTEAVGGDNFYTWLLFIYLSGALVQLFITVVNFIKIYRITHRAKKLSYEGYQLAVADNEQSPFSWGNYIVISKADYQNQPEIIIQHELIHLKKYHSVDLLVAELAIIILWFNPTIWLLKKEMKDIHEFEVDDTLINQGVDAKEYQLLLIRKAVGEKLYSVANTFNQSSLTKRIRMMLRHRSNPWARLKYICIIALTSFSVLAFARPEVATKLKAVSTQKLGKLIQKQVAVIADNVSKPQQETSLPPTKIESKLKTREAVLQDNKAVNRVEDKPGNTSHSPNSPLCIVNGRETSYEQFEQIAADEIKTVKVLQKDEAIDKYGVKGKNGAVIILLNHDGPLPQVSVTSEPLSNNYALNDDTEPTTTQPRVVFFRGDKLLSAAEQLTMKNQVRTLVDSDTLTESVIMMKGKAALAKYGKSAKNGVLEVYLKKQ